jgi:hypothetical protein
VVKELFLMKLNVFLRDVFQLFLYFYGRAATYAVKQNYADPVRGSFHQQDGFISQIRLSAQFSHPVFYAAVHVPENSA